jgi:two-component system NarL family response regulator
MSRSIISPSTHAAGALGLSATRLLVAAVHDLARRGLVGLAEAQADVRVVAEVTEPGELERRFTETAPDVVLVDFDGPELRDAAARLLEQNPTAVLLALGHHEGDEEIRRALEMGARGYLSKRLPAGEIFASVRSARRRKLSLPAPLMRALAERAGEPRLTTREREVLGLLADGRSNACIATALGIAAGTVKVHIKAILGKMGAADRTEAAVMAFRRGFVRT